MEKIVVSIFLFLSFSLSIYSQPILEFEGGNKYDWGKVKPDESLLKAEIKIWNKGNDTLKIIKIKPSCGCTAAPIDKDIILPNEFGTLSIKFDVSGANGMINKMINFHTNSTDRPYVLYYLNAEVERDLTFEGVNYFNYGTLRKDAKSEKIVQIKNNTDKDIKISEIRELPDYCRININEGTIIPSHNILDLVVSVQSSIPGQFSFTIKLKTEFAKEPDLVISGWGNVVTCSTDQ